MMCYWTVYVWLSMCSLHVSNILVEGMFFICMSDLSFLRVTIIPLMESVISIILTGPTLCSVVISALSKGIYPSVVGESTRSSSKVLCVVRARLGAPFGKGATVYFSQKLSTNTWTLRCHLSSGVCTHK